MSEQVFTYMGKRICTFDNADLTKLPTVEATVSKEELAAIAISLAHALSEAQRKANRYLDAYTTGMMKN